MVLVMVMRRVLAVLILMTIMDPSIVKYWRDYVMEWLYTDSGIPIVKRATVVQ